MSIFKLLNRDSEDEPEKPEGPGEWDQFEAGLGEQEAAEEETPETPKRTTKKVVHRAKSVASAPQAEEESAPPPEGDASGGSVGGGGSMGASQRAGRFRTRLEERREAIAAARAEQAKAQGQEAPPAEAGETVPAPKKSKFSTLVDSVKEGAPSIMPRKYLMRPALWDFSSIFSLVMNAILVAVVILLAVRIRTLQNTLSDLLGGLYDNFVRMDRSYITTTIAVDDYPIPVDFMLPVTQTSTNVTLTQAVTIRNAFVNIDTGEIRINSAATVTLPAGTVLPVSLGMEVPVQTTLLVDLRVPVNIELAAANSSDPSIANLHTAFLGLQDTIGPLYCLLKPNAFDYRGEPVCDIVGLYVRHNQIAP